MAFLILHIVVSACSHTQYNALVNAECSLLSYCWIASILWIHATKQYFISFYYVFFLLVPSLLCLLSPFISYSFTYSASAYFLKRLSTHTCDLNHSYTIILELYCVCRRMLVFYGRLERAKTIYIELKWQFGIYEFEFFLLHNDLCVSHAIKHI